MKILFSKKSIVFLFISSVVLLFAFYTDHRWEDWYITFRASKNLALGNGLVYNVGERVHSFTSPLGTIIPAFLSYIGGPDSDEFVIWGFRVICSIILSLTGVQLFNIFKNLGASDFNIYWVLGLFVFNILIVDFSINGMETAFMMLFMVLFIKTVIFPDKNTIIKLALYIAALMYTRPDAIVYFGSVLLGLMVFIPAGHSEYYNRRKMLMIFFKAGFLAFLFYLPWLLGVFFYYGSFIPHTIIAKGAKVTYSIKSLGFRFLTMPFYMLKDECVPAGYSFMPPYSNMGSWSFLHWFSLFAGLFSCLCFLYPKTPKMLRALSFSSYVSIFYLFAVNSAMPWYLPNISLLIIIVLGLFFHYRISQLLILKLIQYTFLIFNITVFILGALMIKNQQKVIEFGNRKQIGLWLRDNSHENQTVFLECLGYIGFYSGLKTYDFPGMSSPEVVESRKKLGKNITKIKRKKDEYAYIIDDLKPDWIVLRPIEVDIINSHKGELLSQQYTLKKTFDVSDKIPNIMGVNYLRFDQEFLVYKKNE